MAISWAWDLHFDNEYDIHMSSKNYEESGYNLGLVCYNQSCTSCVFHILGKVDSSEKPTIWDPFSLPRLLLSASSEIIDSASKIILYFWIKFEHEARTSTNIIM